ncbi:unnamed protein product [Protopolystoma xenopodis]|uniref:Uncharacterized protein n=1 Tax=Protopolystoma xenopodis TaxID=117903 RepID=A0A3S5FCJ7_9PLAT|nr:unnamed protein product [Protopolystoma xenopodis]
MFSVVQSSARHRISVLNIHLTKMATRYRAFAFILSLAQRLATGVAAVASRELAFRSTLAITGSRTVPFSRMPQVPTLACTIQLTWADPTRQPRPNTATFSASPCRLVRALCPKGPISVASEHGTTMLVQADSTARDRQTQDLLFQRKT